MNLPCLQIWLVVCQAPAAFGFLVEEQKGIECELTELVVPPSPRPLVHRREVSPEAVSGSAFKFCLSAAGTP